MEDDNAAAVAASGVASKDAPKCASNDDDVSKDAPKGAASNDAPTGADGAGEGDDGMRSLLDAAMGLTRLHDSEHSGTTASEGDGATQAAADTAKAMATSEHSLDPAEPLSFPETLYALLAAPQYHAVLSWLPHGRAFNIHDRDRFARELMPRYFSTRANPAGGNFGKGAKYTSFTRRLKRWKFERVGRGPEMGAYFHSLFLRDMPDLVGQMVYDGGGSEPKARWREQPPPRGSASAAPTSTAKAKGKEKASGEDSSPQREEGKEEPKGKPASRLPAKKRKRTKSHEDEAVVAAATEMQRQQRQIKVQQDFLQSHSSAPRGLDALPRMAAPMYSYPVSRPLPHGPLDRGYGSASLPSAMGYGGFASGSSALQDSYQDRRNLYDVSVFGQDLPAHLRQQILSHQKQPQEPNQDAAGSFASSMGRNQALMSDREAQLRREIERTQQLLLREQRERRMAELGAAEMAAARSISMSGNARARSMLDAEFQRQFPHVQNRRQAEDDLRASLYSRGGSAMGYPPRQGMADGTTNFAASGLGSSYHSIEGIAPAAGEEMARRMRASSGAHGEIMPMAAGKSPLEPRHLGLLAPEDARRILQANVETHRGIRTQLQQRVATAGQLSKEELSALAQRVPEQYRSQSNQQSALPPVPETNQQPRAGELEEKVEQKQPGRANQQSSLPPPETNQQLREGELEEEVEPKQSDVTVAQQGLRDSLDGQESGGLVRKNSRASAA